MISFEVWTDRRIGIIEPTGSLDDTALTAIRDAIIRAERNAGTHNVVIVEDSINYTSDKAIQLLIAECIRLRGGNGRMVLVSTDGAITQAGRPSSKALFLPVYNQLEAALASFEAEPAQ